ncbi:invasion associated locus B family protein [Devosia sp. XJ19-1]|uniref:Invasion associated locus B family protein n=1 Tax=Devosia ureilytica TaxID=2952754 RepID=A0A9Q4FSE5_9HYPH|nr:invasion associated locus B family protein [Devosia ureilytica]MCP8882852.1 invasion associated locus B family protein [Devosia ureilytica]MCP8886780.1 invasion associated locus B family protein [Devosia ureilytica]
MIRISALPLASLLILAALVPAQAQSARVLGDFRDWSSFAADDGGGTICFAMTKPKTTEPTPEGYGDAYLYITNRPSEDVAAEFNVVAGYTFQTGSVATASVGGQDFALFTQNDAAWLDDSAQAANLAAAIRAGSTVTITGTSATGTKITQSYSLSGATAAQQAIGAEC